MRLAARHQARGQKFRQMHDDKPGPRERSRPCLLLGSGGVSVHIRRPRDSIRLWLPGTLLQG
jgi:hypothetical protein